MHFKKYLAAAALAATVLAPYAANAAPARADLRGKILLQVQKRGEAWYVRPGDGKRLYLANGTAAFEVMRSEGVGITENDIFRIPIGVRPSTGTDTDGDGFSDALEDGIGTDKTKADTDGDGFSDMTEIIGGYNAYSASDKRKVGDATFASANRGRILLQVEKRGEAWWVNPADGKRYFLGRPDDAYELMRSLGLGITTADLELIDIAQGSRLPDAAPAAPAQPTEPPPTTPSTTQTIQTATGFNLIREASAPADGRVFGIWNDGTEAVVSVDYDFGGGQRHTTYTSRQGVYERFERVSGTTVETLSCLSGGLLGLPTCKKETSTWNQAVIDQWNPRTAPSAAIMHPGATVSTETVDGQPTTCYLAGITKACYFFDNLAMPADGAFSAGFYGVGNAAYAERFAWPTEYRDYQPPLASGTPLAAGGPSPIGTGYTQKGTLKLGSFLMLQAMAGNAEEADLTKPIEVTLYVDDVSRQMLREVTLGGRLAIREWTKEHDGMLEVFSCEYEADPADRPDCKTESKEYDPDGPEAFPSDTEKVSQVDKYGYRVANRAAGTYQTDCYTLEDGSSQFCFYNDLASVITYLRTEPFTQDTTSLVIGQPDSSVFVRPVNFDQLQ